MFRKTFSQKAARVFEIVDYVLLVPSAVGLLFGLVMLFNITSFFYGLAICAVFTIGTLLLIGYFKHSRGTLDEEKIFPLWGGTLVYNVLPLLPVFYRVFIKSDEFHNFSYQQLLSPFALFCIFLVFWWIVAVSLSIGAIYSELTESQQYR